VRAGARPGKADAPSPCDPGCRQAAVRSVNQGDANMNEPESRRRSIVLVVQRKLMQEGTVMMGPQRDGQ
jgi:hypothetical protein